MSNNQSLWTDLDLGSDITLDFKGLSVEEFASVLLVLTNMKSSRFEHTGIVDIKTFEGTNKLKLSILHSDAGMPIHKDRNSLDYILEYFEELGGKIIDEETFAAFTDDESSFKELSAETTNIEDISRVKDRKLYKRVFDNNNLKIRHYIV